MASFWLWLPWRRSWSCRSALGHLLGQLLVLFLKLGDHGQPLLWVVAAQVLPQPLQLGEVLLRGRPARASRPASLALTWAIWLLIVSSVPWSVALSSALSLRLRPQGSGCSLQLSDAGLGLSNGG